MSPSLIKRNQIQIQRHLQIQSHHPPHGGAQSKVGGRGAGRSSPHKPIPQPSSSSKVSRQNSWKLTRLHPFKLKAQKFHVKTPHRPAPLQHAQSFHLNIFQVAPDTHNVSLSVSQLHLKLGLSCIAMRESLKLCEMP